MQSMSTKSMKSISVILVMSSPSFALNNNGKQNNELH